MTKSPRGALLLVAFLAISSAASGCGKTATTGAGPMPMGGGPPGGGGNPKIKQAMNKIGGKSPTALSARINQELNAEPPAWETIQPQAAEYAKLTAELGQMDPPKGSKESWTKLTTAFSASATALDKAVQAKDVAAARAADMQLMGSCMDCHREHRGRPDGPGGPGGPPAPPDPPGR